MGFISLVDEIQFMLISRRHICIRSLRILQSGGRVRSWPHFKSIGAVRSINCRGQPEVFSPRRASLIAASCGILGSENTETGHTCPQGLSLVSKAWTRRRANQNSLVPSWKNSSWSWKNIIGASKSLRRSWNRTKERQTSNETFNYIHS